MTLGKKLANYRKLAGLTQQQLGERLNISPQAISKWENDLAEPDLSTIRALSKLYNISIVELIEQENEISLPVIQESQGIDEEELKEEIKEDIKEEIKEDIREDIKGDIKEGIVEIKEEIQEIVGFCKNCGIRVTKETLGEKSPVILCTSCKEKRDNLIRVQKENEEREIRVKRERNIERNCRRLKISMIVAGIFGGLFLLFMTLVAFSGGGVGGLLIGLVGGYIIFTYIACMFYDCFVRDMFFEWMSKSFRFPGLIFSFDLDGIIWLIGMKILFWAIGALLGLISAFIGIAIGMICAPIAFPFIMLKMLRANNDGVEFELL